MKKLILSIIFILCLSFQASAWNPMVVVSGGGGESCIGEFCSDWNNVGADDEVCAGGCPDTWDSLTDASTKMSVNTTNDELEYLADSVSVAYLTEDTDIVAWTEFTMTFTVEFSGLDPHDSNSYYTFAFLDSDAEQLCYTRFFHAGADLRLSRRAYLFDDSNTEDETANLSLTANTKYSMYIYLKKGTDGTSDGYCETGIYDNTTAWVKVGTGGIENYERFNDHGDLDSIDFGATVNEWVDNSITIRLDDVRFYNSDERP